MISSQILSWNIVTMHQWRYTCRFKSFLMFFISFILVVSAAPAHAADHAPDAGVVLAGVAYGNGAYIAVGSKGAVFASTDGDSWTQRYTGTAEDLVRVAHGDGRFVALSSKGLLLTSTDGVIVMLPADLDR